MLSAILSKFETKNRFELCHLASKAIRKFHRPGTRIEQTAASALQRLAGVEQRKTEQETATNGPVAEMKKDGPRAGM